MKQYLELISYIKENGEFVGDRTGTGVQSVFGYQYRVNLQNGFPLLTTKKVNFKNVVADLLWMLSGSTNVRDLQKVGVHIWDEWALENGQLGPVYGQMWRSWEAHVFAKEVNEKTTFHGWVTGYIDQIQSVIDRIIKNPNSRNLIVTAYNPTTIPDESISPQENVLVGNQCLASCQTLFQFKVYGNKLHLQLYQRSLDVALGCPYNLAEYVLLLHLVAHQTNLIPGEFIHSIGDAHIYSNHQDQLSEQLTRVPYELPKLIIKRKLDSIFDYEIDDFELIDYRYHPFIKFPVAV